METEQKRTESQPPNKKVCRTPPVRRTVGSTSTAPPDQSRTKPLPVTDLALPSTFMIGSEPEIVQARPQPDEIEQEKEQFPKGSIGAQVAYLDNFGESEIGLPMVEQLYPLLEELFQKEKYFHAAIVSNGSSQPIELGQDPEAYRLKAHELQRKCKLDEHLKESVFATEIRNFDISWDAYKIVSHNALVPHWFVKAPRRSDQTADPGPIFNWANIYRAYATIPKESKYFVIRGSRLFEMLKNFSSAAQYVVKCFRITIDNITAARAAYNNPFEKRYTLPGDREEDLRVFFKLCTDAFESMQELNTFAKNFEKMRKQLFQFKMHFVQHDILDLVDFHNRKIFVAQLEQKAIEYEKLAAQKRVQAAQAEAASKVLNQVSHPAVPAGPSSTQAEHPKSSHPASLPPYTTNTTKEIGASTASEQSSGSHIPEIVQVTIHQHDTAVHITAPQSPIIGPSTTLGQHNHNQSLPITSCVGGPQIQHADPANSMLADMVIDPILLSQGQPHCIQQFPSAMSVKGPEIRRASPPMTFATPPRHVIAPSGLPHQPHFPESSPNAGILQTPHGIPAFPLTTPPVKAAGPSGTPSQLGGSDLSTSTQVLRMHPDSELGFLHAATKPHELTVRTLDPLIPIRDPPSTAVIAMGLPLSQVVQSNHGAGGAVAGVPRQLYDQPPANMSPNNVQEHTSGYESIDQILGFYDLQDF